MLFELLFTSIRTVLYFPVTYTEWDHNKMPIALFYCQYIVDLTTWWTISLQHLCRPPLPVLF